jgi:hypothetical protein
VKAGFEPYFELAFGSIETNVGNAHLLKAEIPAPGFDMRCQRLPV